jgi:hypothetical protein
VSLDAGSVLGRMLGTLSQTHAGAQQEVARSRQGHVARDGGQGRGRAQNLTRLYLGPSAGSVPLFPPTMWPRNISVVCVSRAKPPMQLASGPGRHRARNLDHQTGRKL